MPPPLHMLPSLLLAVGAVQQPAARPAPVVGTYHLARQAGAGCWLEVGQVTHDSVRVQLSCTRGAPSWNLGFIDERLAVRGGEALWSTTEFGGQCELRFRFSVSGATVEQTGGDAACGFGFGVNAGGSYTRTSRRPPPFDLSPCG